jgi:hypothetical protein
MSKKPVPPQGTCGWGVCCYGVWYAVAANWAKPLAPVYFLGSRGQWLRSHWRAADFRHSPLDALQWCLSEAPLVGDVYRLLTEAEPLCGSCTSEEGDHGHEHE